MITYDTIKGCSIWVIAILAMGFGLGLFIKPDIGQWYEALNQSSLTPPRQVFPIVWSILYGMIGVSGWLIWRRPCVPMIGKIKLFYGIQLVLNGLWTPVFFRYHLTGVSLLILMAMDCLVGAIIVLAYGRIQGVSWWMMPYFLWLLFATYLNLYIWMYNG